jgi:hypothetical protein
MAKNSSVNLDITPNADGYDVSGGTTKRKLTVTGADITLTGSGTNTYTFPSATDTLVGRASTDTLTNKTLTAPVINGAITGDAIATGTTINTGTANDDIVTSKAIADSLLARINSGTYTGNASANRAVAHGLGRTPKMVIIARSTTYATIRHLIVPGQIGFAGGVTNEPVYAVTTWDSTSFYVGNASNYDLSSNDNGTGYNWVAYG